MGSEIFHYQARKDGIIRIFWEGRCVMVLGGSRAEKLRHALKEADEERTQALLRRVTGNFKRGNEKRPTR